jgi:two-component system cell cycle response regulator
MSLKILTVDDSKTVRLVVRKAFKAYQCEIVEAGDGVEGLSVASKESPDLILLDVTMPVMDGVEMLTRLKSDVALKAIPVIMLTAEGGRDHVLKVAKLGVRDYIVKPFKEELLVEKAGRIVDLKPISEGPAKAKSISDTADILVVDDKPAITEQIREGLAHLPWRVHAATSQGEAVDFCARATPDLVVVSLSLPDEAAYSLFRMMRASVKTKYTPVLALVVKTELAQQQQAQRIGLSAFITKPIDLRELESKASKAMNIDTSKRYFALEAGMLVMRLPAACSPSVVAEADLHVKAKIAEAVDAGLNTMAVDAQQCGSLEMAGIKLLFKTMQICAELGVRCLLVGNPGIVAECKGFEDTRNWKFAASLDEVRSGAAA